MSWFSKLVGAGVGFLIGGPVGAVIGFGVGSTKVGEKIVDSVIDFVVQPFLSALGIDNNANLAESQRQEGILVTRRGGGTESIPVVYGHRKVGGIITFAETGSTNNRYLWVAYVFSEGPVEGLFELYIDDIQIASDTIGQLNAGQTVKLTTGKFADRVELRWSPGVIWNTPSSSYLGKELKSYLFKDSPSYKESMVYNGLATLFVRYEWKEIKTQADADANPFNGSIPDASAVILGRKISSLVTSTSEGYAYDSSNQRSTERYSTNPAEILLDYLRNPRYGKGLKNSDIDWASFRTAAAKCNQQVTYTTSGTRGPIMTMNYVVDTNQKIFDNVKTLLQNFRAYMPYVQGKYKLKIEDAGNDNDITSGSAFVVAKCSSSPVIDPVSAVQIYEIQGDVQYQGIDRANKYNQTVVSYVDARPESKWSVQQVVFPREETDREYYAGLDGNRENKLEMTFSGITNYAMAYDFAKLLFFKSRYQETCTLTVSSHAFELEPGDNILIDSRLLAFGSIPWRVINITYNNDYTFTLSCVRNPDWIYPYTKANEVDRYQPPYIPRGVEIYYPAQTLPNYGLIPPTRAPYIPGVVIPPSSNTPDSPYIPGVVQPPGIAPINPEIINPPPTNPTNPDGGGVGDPNGDINNDGINDNPPEPPKPRPLDDVIDFTNVTYVTKNNLIYARLTFNQPSHAMYAGLLVYYRGSADTGYQSFEENTLAGINKPITFDLGPLGTTASIATSQTAVWARVKYADNKLSERYIITQLDPSKVGGINPVEYINISAQSWLSEEETKPSQARRDTQIAGLVGSVASMGSSGAQRTSLIFNITQNLSSQPVNLDIDGVKIYWKSTDDTYFRYKKFTFVNYVPGAAATVAFDGDIGVVDSQIYYNFILQYTYKDGTESSHINVLRWAVQNPLGTYPFNPATETNATRNLLNLADYTFTTVDQAPPGTVASALDTKLGIAGVYSLIANSSTGSAYGIELDLYAPAQANLTTWRGIKIRYRAVVPGTNPSLTEVIDSSVKLGAGQFGGGVRVHSLWGIKFKQVYQVIITPQVFSGGVIQDSNYSLVGKGYVNIENPTSDPNYPVVDGNWRGSWNFVQQDTKTAISQGGQAFDPLVPTLDILNIVYNIPYPFTTNRGWYKVNASTVAWGRYYQLKYNGDKIPGLTKIRIYRRTYKPPYGQGSAYMSSYYQVGRWEMFEVAHSGTGDKLINFRPPTDYTEFNKYYQTTAYGTYFNTTSITLTPTGEDAGTVPIAATGEFDEFLIIPVVGTTVSTKAHRVYFGYPVNNFQEDITLVNKPAIIEYASAANIRDADFTNGYLRRLGEARTTQVPLSDFPLQGARELLGITSGITTVYHTPSTGPAIV